MENLVNRELYGADLANDIEALGGIATGIANRWLLGWPTNVQSMLDAKTFFDLLVIQVDQEKQILTSESAMRHLSPAEILSVYEIKKSPPC